MSLQSFIAVDWGTSSFRFWLISADGHVLAERRSDEGMTVAREIGFNAVLAAHIAAVGAGPNIPVVICGMAGSRQGWIEAAYIDCPMRLSDIVGKAVQVDKASRPIFVLPGIAQRTEQRPDVMRGEETQLLGAMAKLGRSSARICMPGTHSKWVQISNGVVEEFATFMTGELFAAVGQNTILSHAIGVDGSIDVSSSAFQRAVLESYEAPERLTNLLFSIRSGQLLFEKTEMDRRARLSGLLIGHEIAAGNARPNDRSVVLVASGKHASLYKAAFDALSISVETVDADLSVRAGLIAAAHGLHFEIEHVTPSLGGLT